MISQVKDLLSDADLLSWAQQLLSAIAYLHTKVKVVHRDIKPAYTCFFFFFLILSLFYWVLELEYFFLIFCLKKHFLFGTMPSFG